MPQYACRIDEVKEAPTVFAVSSAGVGSASHEILAPFCPIQKGDQEQPAGGEAGRSISFLASMARAMAVLRLDPGLHLTRCLEKNKPVRLEEGNPPAVSVM